MFNVLQRYGIYENKLALTGAEGFVSVVRRALYRPNLNGKNDIVRHRVSTAI